jgi:hypothetical protein
MTYGCSAFLRLTVSPFFGEAEPLLRYTCRCVTTKDILGSG